MSPNAAGKDGPNEESPLLGHDVEIGSSGTAQIPSRLSLLRRNVYVLAFLLLILIEIGDYLLTAPVNMILESIICRDYYPELAVVGGLSDNPRCKSEAVQSELATLRGWTMTFDYIPGEHWYRHLCD